MVAYGPWVQDADFTPFWKVDTTDPDNYLQEIAEVGDDRPFESPVYAITAGDLFNVFDAAFFALANTGGWVEYLTSGYQLSFPDWNSDWACKMWSRRFPLTNRDHFYNPPNHGSTPPDGAIGIDYANQPYNPDDPWGWALAENLSLRLTPETGFEGKFEDERVLGGDLLPWGSTSDLMLGVRNDGAFTVASIEGPTFSTEPNWYRRTFGEALDLTPYGALEPGWFGELYTVTETARIGGDPGPYETTRTKFGWLLYDLRFEADVRPPLYRWVYPAAPYRRTFPRDDGLAGGAGRTYPPSRAVQTSNRTSGYL